jgi:hypothetical protein
MQFVLLRAFIGFALECKDASSVRIGLGKIFLEIEAHKL